MELEEARKEAKVNFPEYKLNDISELEYGFTDTAQETGNARFIRITDISENGTLIKEGSKFVTINDENRKYLLNQGDLLVARTGATFGKTLYFENSEDSIFASYLIRIKFNSNYKVLPKFYWYFSLSELYWQQARKLVTALRG
jgi:hypothetical protein